VSEASNVERQLARYKTTQPKGEEIRRSTKKGESMATFVRTSPKSTNDGNFNKNGKGKQKKGGQCLTLQERKEKKYPFNDMMFRGYLMRWWLQKSFLFQSHNDLSRST